jgi:hypothetical protein
MWQTRLRPRFPKLPDQDETHNGVHVTMFYDRIEEVALSVPPSPAKILSNALAHEIGHVLLGCVWQLYSGSSALSAQIRAPLRGRVGRALEVNGIQHAHTSVA